MAKGYHPIRRRSSDPISESNYYSERINNSYSAPSNSRLSMNAIRSGLTLPLNNTLAIPIYSSPSREDVEVGGRVLFEHFIQEEFSHEGYLEQYSALQAEIPPPEEFGDAGPDEMLADANANGRAEPSAYLSTPDGFKNSDFIEIGARIKSIAEEFAHSRERQDIHRLADEVDLGQITYNTFHRLLTELFRNGIDKYRIVSLFYFCSDILIRCVKEELAKIGSKLFFWALKFILNNVCKWVYEHGGWESVCKKGFNVAYNIALIGALGIVICCGYVYLRNNWK